MKALRPSLSKSELHALSAQALAHVGDGVFELMVRTRLCLSGPLSASSLHRETVARVRAGAQAGYARALLDVLTEEERAVFLRGRNAHSRSRPSTVTTGEYHLATAFDALWGYLYLSGRSGRLEELFARLPLWEPDATRSALLRG